MKHSVRGNIDPFIVMDVMEKARKAEENGRKIIHLEVGQPSTAMPFEALKRTSHIIFLVYLLLTISIYIKSLHIAVKKNIHLVISLMSKVLVKR